MTTLRYFFAVSAVALSAFLFGCSQGVREETIQVKPSNDPLFVPRNILKRYADGEPIGSESTSFPKLVEDVRKVDPARADILESGLARIQKAGVEARPELAKGLLSKLQPSMK